VFGASVSAKRSLPGRNFAANFLADSPPNGYPKARRIQAKFTIRISGLRYNFQPPETPLRAPCWRHFSDAQASSALASRRIMPLEFLVSAFVTLAVVVDPIGLVPSFIAVTHGLPAQAQRRV